MNFKIIKNHIFNIKKAFFEFHHGWQYLYYRYIFSLRILRSKKVLEKPVNTDNLSIHILACHRDILMLLWSLASFYEYSDKFGELFIHDDGSLNNKDKKRISKLFPNAHIIKASDFPQDFSNELAAEPLIKDYRVDKPYYFFIKKLIDPYFISSKKVILILDTDILWFKSPAIITNEISSGVSNSLMMRGIDSGQPVYFKDGTRLSDDLAMLNSGIVLYNKNNFNIGKLNDFFDKIDNSMPDKNYFIEQAGYAYCLDNLQALPTNEYHIKGEISEQTVVKHYTSPRRPQLYFEGIKKLSSKIKL